MLQGLADEVLGMVFTELGPSVELIEPFAFTGFRMTFRARLALLNNSWVRCVT